MDASASPKVDADINDVYALFLKIENTDFPTTIKQRSTVIKYTKLPEFDFESKGSWPQQSYSLQPRLRRIITLDEPQTISSRSLKIANPLTQPKTMATLNKRKIVTISEDEEYDLHPKFSIESKKTSSLTSNRSVNTEIIKEGKQMSHRKTFRQTSSVKCLKETKPDAKINNMSDRREDTPKSNFKSKMSHKDPVSAESIRPKNAKEKETPRKPKSVAMSRSSVSKNFVKPIESDKELSHIKAKLYESLKETTSHKKSIVKPQKSRSPPSPNKSKASFLIERNKHKSLPIIHVPLDEKCHKPKVTKTEVPSSSAKPTIVVYTKSDGTMDTEIVLHKDINTETEPLPRTADQVTDMEGFEPELVLKCFESTDVQTDLIEETFDKLDIPNVSLKKDKSEYKNLLLGDQSKSLPNLKIPGIEVTDNRKEKSIFDAHYCKSSTSYVISRATLTYRRQQKINFHVVDGSDNTYSNQSPSPLKYPRNVVSVYKEEMNSKDISNNISLEETHESESSKEFKNCINEIKSVDCSYVPNSKKLMKPSDIISTIRVNNDLLQSVYLCEQFQRELNFIDSFFESLQYLENCSLAESGLKNDNIDQLVNSEGLLDSEFAAKNSEYDSFISKLENGANSEDSETMASKNLFLLNILIRDEQRRAKNLLSVLKRREDALKDFTKSQILYLENKKKQDNTDISALKKKQRGALLKLQHECGEMQRMRKALLTLSEKRKVALMKTKKDLELKLKNTHVNVEQIILGKKKLKRNTAVDRSSVPLKCFDLSSSGCEDSTASRYTSESVLSPPEAHAPVELVTCAEKSIQTSDGILEATLVNQSTATAAEHFVVVDGSYLNILFHNLSLPQIFSGGKQYEVNEDALKNIIDSTNSLHGENWSEIVEKLMNRMKIDEDKSSTPSTARSLVEEFEQYYKTLAEEDRSPDEEDEDKIPGKVYKTSDAELQASLGNIKYQNKQYAETMTDSEMDEKCVKVLTTDEACECTLLQKGDVKETGPLPVLAGAADIVDTRAIGIPSWPSPKSSETTFNDSTSASSQPPCELASSVASLSEPARAEAEELRRQQLAIEREIKELEQQQCRLLVVREIPDKPPPPYTPPSDPRVPKPPRAFHPDDVTRDRIRHRIAKPEAAAYDPTDAFQVLVHDFCQETVDRHKLEQSDKPWDSCNLLPQKTALDTEKLVESATSELVEVLTAATPSIASVTGVSSRRSDHIDDILFAEWQRVEPEWTSLNSDETLVKNQLFETIFQRILTETVDEYKRTVLSPTLTNK